MNEDSLDQVLRQVGREQLGLEDGDYFDSMVFTRQAQAVKVYIKKLLDDSNNDVDFLIWAMNR